MKIVAISGDKVYYRIGTDLKNSAWYRTEKVKEVVVNKGDEVELTFEKDKEGINILNSIKVVAQVKPPETVVATASSSTSTGVTSKVWRQKSADESEEIRRQAVGKMVAESVKALTPPPTIEILIESIKMLYKTYDDLTKG